MFCCCGWQKTWFSLHLSWNWSPIYTPIVSKLARKNLPYMEEFFLTRKIFHENSSPYHQWILLSDIACPWPYKIAYEAVQQTTHRPYAPTQVPLWTFYLLLLRITKDLILLHLSGNWSPIYTPNVPRLARKNLPYMEEFFFTRKIFHENSSLYHQLIIPSDIGCPRPYTTAHEAVQQIMHRPYAPTNWTFDYRAVSWVLIDYVFFFLWWLIFCP